MRRRGRQRVTEEVSRIAGKAPLDVRRRAFVMITYAADLRVGRINTSAEMPRC